MKVRNIAAAAAIAFAAGNVAAQDTGAYIGGSFGQSSVDIDSQELSSGLTATGIGHAGLTTDEKDTAWKAYIGYRFNRNLAVEGGYAELGKFQARTTVTSFLGVPVGPETLRLSIESQDTLFIAGLASLPLGDRFSLFGKLGFYTSTTQLRASFAGFSDSVSDTDQDMLFGFGGEFSINRNLSLRAEWERFQDVGSEDTGEGDIDLMSVGVIYKF